MNRLCVFCGSQVGGQPVYAEAARALGRLLAAERIGLVYGAGHVGLMGVLADAVLRAGGEAIGVIPHGLAVREVAHTGLTELHVVDTMHERKALMAELSDGFVALPGGLGTLEELAEVLTWAQLGIHRKPVGLLNVAGYFDPLVGFLDHAEAEGFVRSLHRELLLAASTPEAMLHALRAHVPPTTPRWLDLPQS